MSGRLKPRLFVLNWQISFSKMRLLDITYLVASLERYWRLGTIFFRINERFKVPLPKFIIQTARACVTEVSNSRLPNYLEVGSESCRILVSGSNEIRNLDRFISSRVSRSRLTCLLPSLIYVLLTVSFQDLAKNNRL